MDGACWDEADSQCTTLSAGVRVIQSAGPYNLDNWTPKPRHLAPRGEPRQVRKNRSGGTEYVPIKEVCKFLSSR